MTPNSTWYPTADAWMTHYHGWEIAHAPEKPGYRSMWFGTTDGFAIDDEGEPCAGRYEFAETRMDLLAKIDEASA